MPYIVIKSNGREIDRRELSGGWVVGRAPDCDVVIRDILLSRRHCRLEPDPLGWRLTDLQSKNGTAVNGEKLTAPHILQSDDVVRIGRSTIVFHAGALELDFAERHPSPPRPPDPSDSLAGTLSGFTLLLPGEGDIPDNMPCPQPRPRDPAAYDNEELQTLLTAIASSSWDSIYAGARQPAAPGGSSITDEETRPLRRARPRSPTDLSLQVTPISPSPLPLPAMAPLEPQGMPLRPWRRFIAGRRPALRQLTPLLAACLCIATILVLGRHRKSPAYATPTNPNAALATLAASSENAPNIADNATYIHTSPPEDPDSPHYFAVSPGEPASADSTPADLDPLHSTAALTRMDPPKHADIDAHTLRLAGQSAAIYVPILFW